jgi:hypothetical protein
MKTGKVADIVFALGVLFIAHRLLSASQSTAAPLMTPTSTGSTGSGAGNVTVDTNGLPPGGIGGTEITVN